MTMRVGDWQSESDMESIPNSFDGYQNRIFDMSHLLLLGKFEYTGGPIFKVVLEC